MMDESGRSPWLCHVCNYTSSTTESIACSLCYKTTCSVHLKHVTAYNAESGLYELQPVCIHCAAAKLP